MLEFMYRITRSPCSKGLHQTIGIAGVLGRRPINSYMIYAGLAAWLLTLSLTECPLSMGRHICPRHYTNHHLALV